MMPAVADMQPSPAAVALIKASEGLCLKAYSCPGGVLTIGYGHTRGVKLGDVVTEHQADVLLASDIAECRRTLADFVTVPVTQGQFDALIDFTFNLGAGNFANSTLLKLLNAGSYVSARVQLKRYVYGGGRVLPGLVKRREAEFQLWGSALPDFRDVIAGSETTAE